MELAQMEVIPAIDIKDGRCVRLYQGDYGRETVYSDSPLDVAFRWVAMGASRLHVVDLDGAKTGASVNLGLISDIASSVTVPVQLGGGIRTVEAAGQVISAGVSRVIIGTAAAEGEGFVKELCQEFGPDSVAVGVDARDGYVVTWGWTETSDITASEMVKRISAWGVLRFVYTDVTRDGTLTEPNFDAIDKLLGETDMKMIVAGGVASLDHLRRLSQLSVEGAIVGTAAYTGDIDLQEAIAAISQQ